MSDLTAQQKKNVAFHILNDMIISGVLPADTWESYVIENPISVFPKGTIRRFMSSDAIKRTEEIHPSPARWRNLQAEGGQWHNVNCQKPKDPLS